jgi:hypothetical protein
VVVDDEHLVVVAERGLQLLTRSMRAEVADQKCRMLAGRDNRSRRYDSTLNLLQQLLHPSILRPQFLIVACDVVFGKVPV